MFWHNNCVSKVDAVVFLLCVCINIIVVGQKRIWQTATMQVVPLEKSLDVSNFLS